MSLDAGSVESFIKDMAQGGWETFEAADDAVTKALGKHRKTAALSTDDKKTIAAAWHQFATQVPGGEMALQALVDRTLNRTMSIAHQGFSMEQVAMNAAYRDGQNFVVNLILNQIREAREEETKQRDQQ